MFRCKECGTEFDTKPDFCDCGNDTFDEIMPETELTEQKPVKENSHEKETTSVQKKQIRQSYYDYSYWDKIKSFFDPLSTIIFIICLLLSLYVIFYAWNHNENETGTKPPTEQIQSDNIQIPSIDRFWNDTPPVSKVKEEKPVVEEIKKIVVPLKKTEQKYVKPVQKKQELKKQEKSKTTTVTKTAAAQKTTTSANSKPQTTKPVSTSTAVVQKPVQPTINKQELTNYKIQLRNRIASRIDFANVIGDGSCVVSFTVTNSGQITNKKFQKQSDNFSLNDVVYNAIMKTTSFNPPPTGYNGEVLRLSVKMYDGNFEVTLY